MLFYVLSLTLQGLQQPISHRKDLKINQEVDIFTEDCKAIVSFWKRK